MATLNIIHVSHLPSAEANRQGKIDAIVIYSIDNGAPSSVIVPEEDATPERLTKIIGAQVAKTSELVGKTFTL
jgi:hypothetical protein